MRKSVVFYICALVFSVGAIYFLCFHDEVAYSEGYERQEQEEQLADQYLEFLIQAAETVAEEESKPGTKENEQKQPTMPGWTDNQYLTKDGVTFTPDYAKGYLDCVLEIEKIKLKRGVYGGSWDDIVHNLDVWMVTVAHPDMILGETAYSIYGHNHTAQALSFNRLPELTVGDTFTLTNYTGQYIYEVTEILSLNRNSGRSKYIDNFRNRPVTEITIFTCGRAGEYWNNTRYKDYILVGTMILFVPITELQHVQ